MIPRFIQEQLIDNCDILVEKLKEFEKIKAQNNMELKAGDKIVCIKKYHKDITIDNTYKIDEINNDYFWFYDDAGDCIPCKLESFYEYFRLEEPIRFYSSISNWSKELKTNDKAYKETEGKLFYELDFEFITQMAERMASNKGKYEPYNWQKLDNIDDLKQSLFRHVLEVMNGNYKDDNREFGHLEAVAINAMFINYQLKRNEVSPSTKINTTDSTGLLTEE